MASDSLQKLLSHPDKSVILTRIDDKAFGQYPAYFRQRIKQLAEALASGKITVDEWLIAMRQEISDLHHAAFMVGSGKQHQLTPEDLAVVAAIIAAQFLFLINWAKQLQDGQEITASTIESRANLYLFAANATTQKAQTAAIGMPELPAYSGDGSSQCLTNDRCYWRIETLPGNGNWDCYWTLSEAEHCPNCLKRAEVWNPLHIRGGQIEPFDSTGLFAEH